MNFGGGCESVGLGSLDIFGAITVLELLERGSGLCVTGLSGADFLSASASAQLLESLRSVAQNGVGLLSARFGVIAFLAGNFIETEELLEAIGGRMGIFRIRRSSVTLGFGGGDFLGPRTALGFFHGGAQLGSVCLGFGNLFGQIACPHLFESGRCARQPSFGLLEGGAELVGFELDQDLAWRDVVALIHQNSADAAADLGANSNVSRFEGAGDLKLPRIGPGKVERGPGGCGYEEDCGGCAEAFQMTLGRARRDARSDRVGLTVDQI